MSRQVRKLVARSSSLRVAIKDPEDVSLGKTDPLRLLSAANGALATYQVFDDDLKMTLRESIGFPTTSIALAGRGTAKLLQGHRVWFVYDDGTIHNSHLVEFDASTGLATIADATTRIATRGAVVRRALVAAPVAMVEFGTPAQNDPAWGFAAAVNPDLLGLLALKYNRFSVEAYLKGAAASNDLDRTWLLLAQFDEVEEA